MNDPEPRTRGRSVVTSVINSVLVELLPPPQRFRRVATKLVAKVPASMVTTLLLTFVIHTAAALVPPVGGVPPLQFVPSRHSPLLGLTQIFCASAFVANSKTRPARLRVDIKSLQPILFMIARIIADLFSKSQPFLIKPRHS